MVFSTNFSQAQKLTLLEDLQIETQTSPTDMNTTQSGGELQQKIVADFNYAIQGTKVLFDNVSKGEIEYFMWEFENCEPQQVVVNPIQAFPGPGTYIVTLLAISKNGMAKAQKTITLH